MIPHESITALHEHYCAISHIPIKFSMTCLFVWEAWLAAGFTQADLDLVVAHIHKRIREKRTPRESLLMRNLIERHHKFSEDLAIAKAELRSFRPPSQREKILKATGRTEKCPTPPKSTRSIVGEKPIELLIKELREAVV